MRSLFSITAFFEDTLIPVSAMDDVDVVTWHDDPEEYDNDDDEAENLHLIVEDVIEREIDPDEIKNEVS